ncbi:MAG: MCE family protein [Deltaproteobacteria bacterium]|nr:MCE family protein [Deltaproteobacteria bacterium]
MPKRSTLLKLSPEAKVGLFVLLGIILLVYMSLRIGGIKFGRAEGYTITVNFDSAAGLDKDASVRVAGVEVGRVKEITLKNSKAHLILEIKHGIKIGKDFTAMLTTKGLLGEKYLELVPGSPSAPPLKDGDEITHTTSYADMDKLVTILSDVSKDVKSVTDSLSKVLGGPEGEQTLRNIVKNIEELSFRVNSIVAKNDEQLTNVFKNLDQFTALLKNEGPGITDEIKLAAKNLNEAVLKTSSNLNSMIDDNRGNLKEGVENLKVASLKLQEAMDNINKVTKEIGPGINDTVNSVNNITKKIDKGEGTLGKLINDPTLHDNINKTVTGINTYIERTENFHTFIGYRGEYLLRKVPGVTEAGSKTKNTKSYFSLRIQPKADKYYLLEVIDDPRGKRKTEQKNITSGATTTTTTETLTSNALKFSAQIAKSFKGVVLRGGIIESTGGAGLDYFLFKNRLKFTFEAFDFNKKGNAHLKASATYYMGKYFFLTGGWDDFASRNGTGSSFVGGGFQFDDDDLKYLLGSAPSLASAAR